MKTGELALFGGAAALGPGAHQRWPIITEDEHRGVRGVLERGILSGMHAPEAVALEREFGAFVGARHCLLTHSGTSALELCLAAAGIGEGDEVIVPSYSFVATALAVVHRGAVPIFVDIEPELGGIDPAAIDAAVGPNTRAIMPVHVHGCPADLDAIGATAARRGLVVVEDAAQAHGATYRGKPVGALAAVGAFSLQSSKNLTGGEGGLVVTNDDALADGANRVRSFGQDLLASDAEHYDLGHPLDGHRSLDSVKIGFMYRGNEMMAAFVRAQLRRLPALTARCQQNALELAAALGELPGVHPPIIPADRTSVHHKVRVRLDPVEAGLDVTPRALRDLMARALRAEGCEVVLWQTAPLPAQAVFQRLDGFGKGFPWSSAGAVARARENYAPSRYPRTTALLDGSLVLFSQSFPFIAQSPETVRAYAEAFRKVWQRRHELVASARAAGELAQSA